MKTKRTSAAILFTMLTLLGVAQPTAAQIGWGHALSLDGVDDYVQSQQDVDLANRSFSVEAWVQRRSSNTMDMVVSQGGGVYNQGLMFGFHYYAGNQFLFDFYGNGVGSGTADTDTAWHHWAGIYDATTKLRCLYRDGVLTASNTNTAEHYQGSGPLKIGIGPGGEAPNEFDGAIDEVRIWGVARSAAEVAANMNGRLTGTEAGLMAYWRFDEGTGTVAYDATGNHRDSDLLNGASWTRSTVPEAPAGWGLALSADGADDYVSATIPALASNYTVSAWVTLRAGGNYWGARVGILSATTCNTSTELLVHNLADSSAPQYLWLGRCGAYDGTNSTATVPTNQWVHVAVAVSSNKQVSYFINGNPAGSWDGSARNLAIGPNITLGDNTARRFNGMLDDVQIWNKARSQAEILAGLGQPLAGTEPNLVAYYRFDEGGGIAAYDATPNHRNGTLVNRPVRTPSNVPPPPAIALFGDNPVTNEFHVPFVDPGATAGAPPASLAAYDHHLALNADGSVLGWGDNYYGQSVAPASAANGVVAIGVGGFHSLVLKTNGSVVAWGYNRDGQTNTPASATSGVVVIAAGFAHNLALKTNGSVVAWGWNGYGQVNVPASASSGVVAITAGAASSLVLKANGSVVAWGSSGQTNVPSSANSGVVAIAAGGTQSLALKDNGAVVVWGDTYYGQTNVPPSATNGVVAIAAGYSHCLALKHDGSVVAWGANDYGQTDLPPSVTTGVVAIEAGRYHSLAIKADGSVVAWGHLSDSAHAVPLIERTLCPGLTTTGTVNVDVPGAYVLTYSVTNTLGIVGTANRTVVVVPDTTPPALPAELVLSAPTNTCEVPLPVITATDTSDPAPTVTCTPPVGSLLPLGRANVVCVATDASGNSRTGTVSVIVLGAGQRLAAAGEIWTQRQAERTRLTVASSAEGAKLVGVEWGGRIHTSTDAGASWTPRESNRYWQSVASSADGAKLVATDYFGEGDGGRIYTSTDSGVTWTPRATNRHWGPIASSADGMRLVALEWSGQIYTSSDAGTNWIATSAPSKDWMSVASSADGTKLVAAEQNGACYTSSDGGLTWTAHLVSWSAPIALASSADGTKLAAALEEVGILTSTNSGMTWTESPLSGTYLAIGSSADGRKLVALGVGGQASFSTDAGATWAAVSTSVSWFSIASSADGNRLVAGTYDGKLYTSTATVVPPLPAPTFVGATDLAVDLAGIGGSVVTFNVTATNSSECTPDLAVICIPPSGSTFPAGTNLVTCLAVDAYGVIYTNSFTIAVRGTRPPTDIHLSNSTVVEQQPPGTMIGALSAIDPEPGDRHVFALVRGDGDTDNDSFAISGNTLQTAAVLSCEFKHAYSIRVRATDSGDLSLEKAFTITVTDANDAPVLDVAKVPALDFIRIGAGAPAGAVGTPISSFVDLGGPLNDVTDDDPGAVTGVAIIGADTNHGTWFYTLDDGTNWNNLDAPSESGALLLSALTNNRVYFQPHTNFIGTVPAALSFRAWDQTTGGDGGTANTTSNGWTTAFSAAVGSADQPVNWGWAVQFDGTNDHVNLGHSPSLDLGNTLTIEAWVKPVNLAGRYGVFSTRLNNLAGSFQLEVGVGNGGVNRLAVTGVNTWVAETANNAIFPNRWTHIAYTRAGTGANPHKLYINGVAQALISNAGYPFINNPSDKVIAAGTLGSQFFAGQIDELRIWDVARTATQITNSMHTTLAGDEPGLVACYRFDEGAGLAASDATTNHLDGVLTNGPVWVPSSIPMSLTPVEMIVGNTRYIHGYWPAGVTRNATPTVPNMVVGGLSDNIQPSSGTPGVKLWNQAANGANGSARYAVGQNAWSGSAGGPVSVTFDSGASKVSTLGPNAHGVVAQSTGGSGGSGGDGWGAITGAGIGGRGGLGGAGGAVTVKTSGEVATSGDASHGVLAVSLAGRGGHGGDGTIWAGIGVSYGGDGRRGGNGGVVQVTGSGQITNTGHNANGVLAVSQGGKGGNGGSGSSIGSGGDGGAGGTGGNVVVSGNWAITTQGTNAHGTSANSLGGSGGTSGSGGWIAGGAGTGGASGDGGSARVNFSRGTGSSEGTIETFGKDSHGIFAQSVGGFAGSGASGGSVFASAGGDGGSAGNGGSAAIVNSGSVTTHGDRANALFAESVGGGGGSSGSGSGWFGGVAGQSKAGGHAGAVSVSSSGEARTYGNEARGIFAQSVGGSGGNSGITVGLLVSIGGSGGDGGDGNTVTVDNTGLVETAGADSSAIFAQSTGGGGGSGGGSGSAGLFGSLAVGGTGGGGGDGGRVIVKSGTNSITTAGTNSHGVFAQSVGGGGGKGGFAIAGSVGLGGSQSIGLGGTGGDGGSANDVVVTSGSTISTHGTNAHGIFAQSVGGGGGEGGFTIAASGSDTYAGTINVGGKGGKGGGGDSVAVTNTGAITTSGKRSYGVLAQSVGGGGGEGGFSLGISGSGTASLPLSFGGSGGDGGDGGVLQVNNQGSISTEGSDAHALFVQSVGGGGGSGGFSGSLSGSGAFAGAFSMGGSGGKGGDGDAVNVASGGEISTSGDRAYGILAQSVGGGGGDGGFSIVASGSGNTALAASLGGSGGIAGDGSVVNLEIASRISTAGSNAHGIFAQSVGGGGGSGGFSVAVTGAGTFGGSLSMGGGGEGGGDGDSVTVNTRGEITTEGDRSYGILAQSVGGGGGDGGFSIAGAASGKAAAALSMGGSGAGGGLGGNVAVNSGSLIATEGKDAHGIFAQSVGGGGGSGGFSIAGTASGDGGVSATLGGKAGGGAQAGNVSVTTSNRISTGGEHAYGILAQSVGGGGGDGGFSVAGGVSKGPSVNLAMGGSGGSGGVAGIVDLATASSISTTGANSHAIFAQSVGGGGGSGGFSVAGGISANNAAVSAAIGGTGGTGANGRNVTVATGSGQTIETHGERSYGLLAQSVGGGGGDGGFSVAGGISKGPSVNFGMGGSGGAAGDGAAVFVTNRSAIATHGEDAHGIFVQSVGGGGGSGGFSVAGGVSADNAAVAASIGGSGNTGGRAGSVLLNSSGGISTTGDRAYGILAQSVGGGGGDGGFSVAGGISKGPAVTFGLGGKGGPGGAGGTVAVDTSSRINTTGTNAHGIFAQSVGGGGGSGGFSVAGGLSLKGQTTVSASIGGKGGGGASASNVTVSSTGTINTSGDHSYGILAQSVGGGGGDGGFSFAGAIAKGPALAFALGGAGSTGGVGRAVSVLNAGAITTRGAEAHGVFAQSVGGGGGSGGFSGNFAFDANALLTNSSKSVSLGASLGGSGGGGGSASAVAVTNTGSIITLSNASHGIMAQSVGGGGGSGGSSLSLMSPIGSGGTKSVDVHAAIGGNGGVGGSGSNVVVLNEGLIETSGKNSYGISAQSIGGGGGNGGDVEVRTVTLDDIGLAPRGPRSGSGTNKESKSFTVDVSIGAGGAGGAAGDGGKVGVTNTGSIHTRNDKAHGIFAQSIGGGGGTGGASATDVGGGSGDTSVSVNFGIGGKGGAGGSANVVTVNNEGSITTLGDASHGIVAQSVGGGGGVGGASVSTTAAGSSDGLSVNLTAAIGGGGGVAGDGRNVAVLTEGLIDTAGEGSYGILAQSIGGGGGTGGTSVTDSGAGAGDLAISATLSLGGKGGGGGSADLVTVGNQSRITTLGDASHGIVAQSIGGGGGMGGASVTTPAAGGSDATVNLSATIGGRGGVGGSGSNVVVRSEGRINTSGQASYGLLAQSIGGGGGSGGTSQGPDSTSENWSLNLALGGGGGAGGKGGMVAITNVGVIATLGNDSHGALVQSIGGGGGNAGSAHSGEAQSWKNLNITVGAQGGTGNHGGAVALANTGSITTHGDGSMGVVAQSIGGSGGAAGDGSTVHVVQDGAIATHGVGAQGIFAQSVGGGGGLAGNVDRGLTDLDTAGLGLGFAQDGGSAGNGGTVTVESAGDITTSGTAANGIFAQSVGGGGGLAGSVGPGITLDFAGSVGGAGDGGEVIVAHDGAVTTQGDAAHGIFAQSVGGTSGQGGSVSIEVTGDITAEGKDSVGIFAQSTGEDGGGNITINIHTNSTVHGGSGASAGVRIEDGAVNALSNYGTITTLNGATGMAIRGGSGNEIVENYGTLIGQVNLGGGVNVWNNHPGSIFNVAAIFSLGAGNTMNNYGMLRGSGQIVGNVLNAGTISPGNSAGRLTIDGNLNLESSAKMTLEIGGRQQGSTYDSIQVSEGLKLDGTLSLSLVNNFRPSPSDSFTLMEFASLIGMFSNAQDATRISTTDNLASFEISYTSTNLVASAYQSPDTDGDGMTDYDEYLAGTEWTNRTSVLTIKSLARGAAGEMVLQFVAGASRDYTIEYSTNLESSAWWAVPTTHLTFPATNIAQWVDDGTLTGGMGVAARFYRVRVQLE